MDTVIIALMKETSVHPISPVTAGQTQREAVEQWPSSYWYQGVFLTQWRVKPASVRILMEAASASLTVSFTDCIRFWALWTNISVAWGRIHLMTVKHEAGEILFQQLFKESSGTLWPDMLIRKTLLTCSDSSSLMLVRPNMVALTVDKILS